MLMCGRTIRMLNNISSAKDLLARTLTQNEGVSNVVSLTASAAAGRNIDRNVLIDQFDISQEALKIFERENDIKKFTNLAKSDPENLSHNKYVEDLFKKGIKDPYEDDILSELVNNSKLWDDLAM